MAGWGPGSTCYGDTTPRYQEPSAFNMWENQLRELIKPQILIQGKRRGLQAFVTSKPRGCTAMLGFWPLNSPEPHFSHSYSCTAQCYCQAIRLRKRKLVRYNYFPSNISSKLPPPNEVNNRITLPRKGIISYTQHYDVSLFPQTFYNTTLCRWVSILYKHSTL